MWRPNLEDLVPPARWPELGLRELILLFLIGVGLLCAASLAWGRGAGFTHQDCLGLGYFVRMTAEVRDLGADVDKHVALVRKRVAPGGADLSDVLERELRRVYAEALPPAKAEESTYTRCMSGEILRADG